METIITLIIVVLLQIEVIGIGAAMLAKNKSASRFKNACFVDTSVLMDGRIMAAAQTGFLPSKLVVPRSVVAELQLLADGSDSDKRQRARHGLDIVSLLQEIAPRSVQILQDKMTEDGVDNQLLMLAKKYDGSICTIDFNLNKVASIEKIPVLNINELAQQLRMEHLPGERVSIKILQKGSNAHQGVGYLSDGTMVVVEQAGSEIGKQLEIEFSRSLQTAAGRMVFAKRLDKGGNTDNKTNTGATNQQKKSNGRKKPQTQPRRKLKPEDSLINLVNEQDS